MTNSRLPRTVCSPPLFSLLLLTIGLSGLPSLAQAQSGPEFSYVCGCEGVEPRGSCFNDGVETPFETTVEGVPADSLMPQYGAFLLGESSTGWFCAIDGTYSCLCAASSCGNDGAGGDNGRLVEDVSPEIAIRLFGVGRTAQRSTGWVCWLTEIAAPTTGVSTLSELPSSLRSSTLYPNPTTGTARYALEIDRMQRVQIALFDMQGRLVEVIHSGLLEPNRLHDLEFSTAGLPSGVYSVRATGEYFGDTRQVV
ncbi:MAG: T9SS type A sorting domain-containing protein, partial [Bacteroidota bacterium]